MKFMPILFTCAALVCPAGVMAEVLQSVTGDVVDFQMTDAPACSDLQCPARVCLENHADNKAPKAIGQHNVDQPPQEIAPGNVACLDLVPLRQAITLWTPDATGTLAPVILAPLDLRNYPGALVWLTWRVEGAP